MKEEITHYLVKVGQQWLRDYCEDYLDADDRKAYRFNTLDWARKVAARYRVGHHEAIGNIQVVKAVEQRCIVEVF